MNPVFRALLTIFLSVTFLSCAAAPLPDYTSEQKIDDELYMVDEIWNGRGQVIVGKIDPLPPGRIACRTPVYKDGSFTAAVLGGKELTFYLHGYDQLLVDNFSEIRNSVSDAGAVRFKRTPEGDLRQWQVAVEAPDFEGEITAVLNVMNKDYLFDDHGYSGGARPFATVASKKVKPGETVTFDGLSPIPYQVVFSGPGLVKQEFDIDPQAKGFIEADPVKLDKATVLEFTFRTRTRKRGEGWKEDAEPSHERVVCDGKAELRLTDARDGLGNSMELRLKPTDEGVSAGFFYYNDENFIELGEGEVSGDLHWNDVPRRDGVPYTLLKSGHRYLLQVKDYNDVDLESLFSVREVAR